MSKKIKTLLIASVIIFIADFFTLANSNFTRDETLGMVGLIVGVASLAVFIVSSIAFAMIKIKSPGPDKATPLEAECPRWYSLTKLFIGLFILFALYICVPVYAGFLLVGHDPNFNTTPLAMKIFFSYFIVLTQYALPIPFGILVWPLTLIGLGFVLFRKKHWLVLDCLGVAVILFIISLAVKILGEA
ncbi:MAG: hypothetical protein PHO90_01855 [Candidatus Pacebacteria bacterium]|nr:hypothetical protein [Candidatus Paceibacterota bacterium]